MKNRILLYLFIIGVGSPLYTQTVFSPSDVLLGISLGGGNEYYSYGKDGAVLNLSSEIIIASWLRPNNLTLSLGALTSGSFFFAPDLFQGGLSLMPSFHVSFFSNIDWYIALGFGITMHKHFILYGAGFATGFNILVSDLVLISMGVDLQGPQIFGSLGIKFRIEILS
ncbi:MAG: hypothetical protein ACRC0X_08185 [Brevinema sp.]